jgi:hypothetical protein
MMAVKLGALNTAESGVAERWSRGTEAPPSGTEKSDRAIEVGWMKGCLLERGGTQGTTTLLTCRGDALHESAVTWCKVQSQLHALHARQAGAPTR